MGIIKKKRKKRRFGVEEDKSFILFGICFGRGFLGLRFKEGFSGEKVVLLF